MIKVTKIATSKVVPISEQCIVHGELNYINYILNETDDYYYLIYSPDKLSNDDMIDVLNNYENLDKYF